jgi:hypothetical protein
MFSKQIIADIVIMLPNQHDALELYLIKKDLDDKVVFDDNDSVLKKKLKITNFLIENKGIKDNYGNEIVTLIVEEKVSELAEEYLWKFDKRTKEFEAFPNLYRFLRLDGYDIDFKNKKLIRSLPEDVAVQEKEDYILKTLEQYGFATSKEHYNQAKSSYTKNNLAAMNSQLRPFTESFFMEMASYIKNAETSNVNIQNINPVDATSSMQVLAKCTHPVLDIALNEWTGDGKGYIQAFWKRLHPQGSHPGIPDIDEAVYRFQLVLINMSYILQRFVLYYR